MRFVAGRGAVAERLQRSGAVAEMLAGSAMAKRMAALWWRAIGKLLPARGTVADSYREAFAGQGRCSGAPSGRSHCRKGKKSHCRKGRKSHCLKGEILLERGDTAGKESHCQKGKIRSATAGKKGLQRSNGLVSFFDAPLMQIIPIFVIW